MPNIIQIEELVYGRLPNVSKADWIAMLTNNGAHADYTTFKDDYLLIEQSDYRFANGKMISSERLHYNINYSTYDGVKNGPSSDDTIEIQVVRYNKRSDRYYVSYAHYLPSEERSPDVSYIYAEADAPSSASAYQPPQEEFTPAPQPEQQQPTNLRNAHQIGGRVIHSKFGKGVILSIDDKYVFCRFGTDLVKKFLYPQAFEQGFLQ